MKASSNCIFCKLKLTNKNRSGEHLFADWIGKIIPKIDQFTNHYVTRLDDQKNYHSTELGSIRGTGNLLSRKINCVCIDCNTRWMRELQELNRPELSKLIKGDFSNLQYLRSDEISRWIAMFTCVAEWADPHTVVIDQCFRDSLKIGSSLGSNWSIWIGAIADCQICHYHHTSLYVREHPKSKIQATLAMIGAFSFINLYSIDVNLIDSIIEKDLLPRSFLRNFPDPETSTEPVNSIHYSQALNVIPTIQAGVGASQAHYFDVMGKAIQRFGKEGFRMK